MYEQELETIKRVYGVDRWSRMKDIIAYTPDPALRGYDEPIHPEVMAVFMKFIERYGKVANDLAMFNASGGSLSVRWAKWNTKPQTHRRGNLIMHCEIIFHRDRVEIYRNAHVDDEPWFTEFGSDEMNSVIENYRTHRNPS